MRAAATRLVTAQVGYALTDRLRIAVDAFNLLDARASDIDFIARACPGERSDGVDDVHFHPALPRTARVSLILELSRENGVISAAC